MVVTEMKVVELEVQIRKFRNKHLMTTIEMTKLSGVSAYTLDLILCHRSDLIPKAEYKVTKELLIDFMEGNI